MGHQGAEPAAGDLHGRQSTAGRCERLSDKVVLVGEDDCLYPVTQAQLGE